MNVSKDLGCQTNLDVINQFVSLTGQFVIDAGCGSMVFTRSLLEQGAQVLAIDPDPVQAELNRTADPLANLEFVETGAEQLPVSQTLSMACSSPILYTTFQPTNTRRFLTRCGVCSSPVVFST